MQSEELSLSVFDADQPYFGYGCPSLRCILPRAATRAPVVLAPDPSESRPTWPPEASEPASENITPQLPHQKVTYMILPPPDEAATTEELMFHQAAVDRMLPDASDASDASDAGEWRPPTPVPVEDDRQPPFSLGPRRTVPPRPSLSRPSLLRFPPPPPPQNDRLLLQAYPSVYRRTIVPPPVYGRPIMPPPPSAQWPTLGPRRPISPVMTPPPIAPPIAPPIVSPSNGRKRARHVQRRVPALRPLRRPMPQGWNAIAAMDALTGRCFVQLFVDKTADPAQRALFPPRAPRRQVGPLLVTSVDPETGSVALSGLCYPGPVPVVKAFAYDLPIMDTQELQPELILRGAPTQVYLEIARQRQTKDANLLSGAELRQELEWCQIARGQLAVWPSGLPPLHDRALRRAPGGLVPLEDAIASLGATGVGRDGPFAAFIVCEGQVYGFLTPDMQLAPCSPPMPMPAAMAICPSCIRVFAPAQLRSWLVSHQ